MKIVIVGNYLSGFGGTETVIKKWLEKLPEFMPCAIEIILTDKSENTDWLAGQAYSFLNEQDIRCEQDFALFPRLWSQRKLKRKYNIELMNQNLRAKLEAAKPDLIICISYNLLSRLDLVRKQAGLKCDLYFWDHMAYTVLLQNDRKFRKVLQLADGFLCISQGIYNATSDIISDPSKRIALIYNPIERKSHTIQQALLPARFIYLGRLIAGGQKQVKDIIDAVIILKDHDFIVDIYGDGIDRNFLEEYVQQHAIGDKVIFHGWQNNAWSCIKEASCLLLSSNFEGLSMVIAEALSYGVPCISSDCQTGPSEMIRPGKNGFLYEPKDVQALATHMLKFIHQELSFDQELIQRSVDFMYSENYFLNLAAWLSLQPTQISEEALLSDLSFQPLEVNAAMHSSSKSL